MAALAALPLPPNPPLAPARPFRGHTMVANAATIGGPYSPWPGAARTCLACVNFPCDLFRDHNGLFGMIADPHEEIAFDCQGIQHHEPIPAAVGPSHDFNLWTRANWAEVIDSFEAMPAFQLEINRLKDLLTRKAAPASLAEVFRATDVGMAVRTLTNMFENIRLLALAPNAPAPHHWNDPIVTLLDDAGSRAVTERFAEFAALHADDRVQFMASSTVRSPWVWQYVNTVGATYKRVLDTVAVAGVTPDLMVILTSKVVWPTDPSIEVDLQAFRVRAGLLKMAAESKPALWLRIYESFWSSSLAQIVEARHTKFLSTGANIADHKLWALAATKISSYKAAGTKPSGDKAQLTWKQKREAKRGREDGPSHDNRKQHSSDKPQHLAYKQDHPAPGGAAPTLYTKCTKCGNPTPNGRPLPNPLCIKCRKQ